MFSLRNMIFMALMIHNVPKHTEEVADKEDDFIIKYFCFPAVQKKTPSLGCVLLHLMSNSNGDSKLVFYVKK